MIADRLLRLITRRLNLASFYLIGFRIGERILIVNEKILGIVGLTVPVDRRVKDPIEPARQLRFRQGCELVLRGDQIGE